MAVGRETRRGVHAVVEGNHPTCKQELILRGNMNIKVNWAANKTDERGGLQELNALRTTCGDAVQAAVEQRQKGNGDARVVGASGRAAKARVHTRHRLGLPLIYIKREGQTQ